MKSKFFAVALLAALATAACSSGSTGGSGSTGSESPGGAQSKLSGQIKIDGSSTVTPLISLAAEDFQTKNQGVQVTVGTSGTGGGFEKFCNGETDFSMASRKIKDPEIQACKAKNIVPMELVVANDGLSVVVNPANNWASCLTVQQLNKIWAPDSKVNNWNQVDPKFPNQKLVLFGAGSDSGTFDYFTGAINGKEKATRADYNASEDDNVTVTGVAGDKGAMGYFGLSYLLENKGKVKGVQIDGGQGCVTASSETVQSGTYQPLGRELFIYTKLDAAKRPEVKAFADFYLKNQKALTGEALFIPMTPAQLTKATEELAKIDAA